MESEEDMQAMQTTAVVSVAEAARILGVSLSTIYNAVRDGDLPAIRFRGRILVPKRQLEEMLESAAEPAP